MFFLKRNLLTMLVLIVLSSLAFQTYVGEHGLQARSVLNAQISGLNKKLHLLRAQRQKLELRTKRLSLDLVDQDLLEYQARELLGFVHEGERVYIPDKR